MSKITFYVQKRADGGKRIGLSVNGETFFQRFEVGQKDWDPSLEWYVDIRCQGETLPVRANEVKSWFLGIADVLARELTLVADDLSAGIDPDVWPVRKEIAKESPEIAMEIVSSAMRRIEPEELAQAMKEIASRLDKEIADLPLLEKAS